MLEPQAGSGLAIAHSDLAGVLVSRESLASLAISSFVAGPAASGIARL